MNRLVIVGNGFDLAHGLPTSYSDFINWYWWDIVKILSRKNRGCKYENEFVSIAYDFFHQNDINHHSSNYLLELEEFKKLSTEEELRKIRPLEKLNQLFSNHNKYVYEWDYHRGYNEVKLNYINSFFGEICEKHIENWVDIENEYYRLLKGCLKEENNKKVIKLNKEFDQVKNLLEKYLNEEIIAKYKFDKPSHLDELLKHFEVRPRSLENDTYLEEFPNSHHEALKKQIGEIIQYSQEKTLRSKIWNGTISENNLILNFNYTYSADKLKSAMNNDYSRDVYGKSEIIQIHGRLNDPENKINFGFGDEMDNHYQQIEEKDDNEYLKFIKSFQYLQNSNYKKVLDYIESDVFQVYIMGHSCGLSDRILLNTIFEHTNCISIKVFYYKNGDWDNYTEIVQNISRHFNKKKMMRDKIVNKSLCVPLPQNIRFETK